MIAIVMLVALLLTLLRVGLHTLEQNKSLLEDHISQLLGNPLTIGTLQARMVGLQPQMLLQQVAVLDSVDRQTVLSLGDLRLGMDLLASILSGGFRAAWVQLSQAELLLQRDQQGQISIAGLPKKQGDSADWLLDGGTFSLQQSEIHWLDLQDKRPKQTFSQFNATLFNHHHNHQLRVSLRLPGARQSRLQLRVEARGYSMAALQGHFYLQGKQVDLSLLLAGRRFQGYQLTTAESDFQLWGDASQAGLSDLSGEIQSARLSAVGDSTDQGASAQAIELTRLATRFQWARQAHGWQLDTDGLTFQMNGEDWPSSAFSLKVNPAQNNPVDQLQAAASWIDLQIVSRLLLSTQWANQPPAQILKPLGVKGKVENLRLSYDAQAMPEHRLSVCGDIRQLAFKPWKKMPGVRNLAGHICGDSARGVIDLATREGHLHWPGSFRKPMSLRTLQGQLSWQAQVGQWRLASESLQLDTPDLVSHHRFQLLLPAASNDDYQPLLDWDGTFTQGRASAVRHYLPIKKLQPELLSWLEQAFVSGQVMEGRAQFKGPLRKFPFKQDEGLFEITFRVLDGELNYGSKWPNVTGLEAQVSFHNNSLQVDVGSGRISGAEIQSTQVVIPGLGKNAHLTLAGTVMGQLEQGVSFARASPLVNSFEPVLDMITPTGNAQLNLQLKIPLAQLDATEIDGSIYLRDSRVNISALDLTLDKLKGAFRFDRNGLASQTIHALALGESIQIDLQHDETTQRIHLQGVADSRELVRYYEPLAELVEGTLPYRLEVRIPWRQAGGGGMAEIELNSSLQGLAIRLPAPLGKAKNDARHFHATLAFPDAETMPLNIKYGHSLVAELDLHHSATGVLLYGGMLGLGVGTVVKRNGQQGLSVSANFNRLDLQQWQVWSKHSASGQQASGSTNSLKSIDFKAQQVSWGDQHWGPVSLNARRKATTWSGALDAAEIKGQFKYATITDRRSRAKLSLDLEYLQVHPTGDKTADQDSIQPAVDADRLDPLAWPDLQIQSEQLFWKSNNLGSMELKTHRQGQILMIDHFNIFDDNHHQIAGSGSWSVQGEAVSTQLQGKLDFMDMGDLLSRLDWAGYIEETRGEADFRLNWGGASNQSLLDTLTGQLSLSLDKGRLISVGPGLGRVLGILNIDTLKRRLMLDFSDLFAQGFAYDGIAGQFAIDAGIAETNDFTVDGIAATLDVRGQLRLPSRTLNLGIQVTPKTSVTLPLAGALAGGPAVGAAVLVAQQLLGDQVDSISSTRYSATGDWADPVITRLKGQGGMLDKVWKGLTDFSDQ